MQAYVQKVCVQIGSPFLQPGAALITQLQARCPADVMFSGCISCLHQQCWGGNHSVHAPPSANNTRPRTPRLDFLAHVEETLGVQNYSMSYPAASITAIDAL